MIFLHMHPRENARQIESPMSVNGDSMSLAERHLSDVTGRFMDFTSVVCIKQVYDTGGFDFGWPRRCRCGAGSGYTVRATVS